MKENNVSKFSAVVKHIEDVLQSNPTIDMVSVTVSMEEYPTKARVCYASKTDVRYCEIEVR